MRFTRCDACGAKALMAASQCPKCSHWLGLRDDHGKAVPLARCRTCQCYYPRQQGECKWCDASQSASRTPTLVWGAVGVVLIAGVAWGAMQFRGHAGAPGARGAPAAQTPPRMRAIANTAAAHPVTRPDPMSPRVLPASPPPMPATLPVEPTVVEAAPTPDSRAASPDPTSATETRPVVPDAESPADTVRPMPGDEGTARTWVNVRAATGRAAEVLGVITPDTRVRFGEARGAWIQVRTDDLTGWADRRLFSVVR